MTFNSQTIIQEIREKFEMRALRIWDKLLPVSGGPTQ